MDKEQVVQAAIEARSRAYAPYSNYSVGAAVLATSGRIYQGCNIENASYGLTICAERVALSSAVAAGEKAFELLVVAGGAEKPGMPCGACRQFIVEWTTPDFPVIVVSASGQRIELSIAELMPYAFDPTSLQEEANN